MLKYNAPSPGDEGTETNGGGNNLRIADNEVDADGYDSVSVYSSACDAVNSDSSLNEFEKSLKGVSNLSSASAITM